MRLHFYKIKKLIDLLTTLDFYVIVLIVFNCRRQQVPKGIRLIRLPRELISLYISIPLSCE